LFLKQSQFWGAALTCFYQQLGSSSSRGGIIIITINVIGDQNRVCYFSYLVLAMR